MKEAEAALARSEEALRQSQKMEAVGQLTGGLAHDFNNLLAGMMGSMEVMRGLITRGRVSEIDRCVDVALKSGRRAAALTQRLLAFSRQQALDPKLTDVNRLVGGMEELLRRSIGPEIELEVVGRRVCGPRLWTPRSLRMQFSISASTPAMRCQTAVD